MSYNENPSYAATTVPVPATAGGTGVVNGVGSTITVGGPLDILGAFATNITVSGITNVTLPTSGTLATTAQIPSTPVSIANGGTFATSMSTSTGIVKYDGTRLVTSSTATINSSNFFNNTAQPCFKANLQTALTNQIGNGGDITIIFDTKDFDQGTNYSVSTGLFTAPVAGNYIFSTCVRVDNISVTMSEGQIYISCSTAGAFRLFDMNFGVVKNLNSQVYCNGTLGPIALALNETVGVHAYGAGQAGNTAGITGSGLSWFCGQLLC